MSLSNQTWLVKIYVLENHLTCVSFLPKIEFFLEQFIVSKRYAYSGRGGGGGWEMGEICPRTKSCPPLIKQKLISTPPYIMIILRLTPPPP